jgi:hypothetical protein
VAGEDRVRETLLVLADWFSDDEFRGLAVVLFGAVFDVPDLVTSGYMVAGFERDDKLLYGLAHAVFSHLELGEDDVRRFGGSRIGQLYAALSPWLVGSERLVALDKAEKLLGPADQERLRRRRRSA